MFIATSALMFAFAACDKTFHDFSFEWDHKIHADSPSGSYVAYVQDGNTSSEVLIAFEGGCSVAMRFDRTHVPLELRWLGASTLQVRYPKQVSPTCQEDAVDHVVDCFGPKVRVIPVQI